MDINEIVLSTDYLAVAITRIRMALHSEKEAHSHLSKCSADVTRLSDNEVLQIRAAELTPGEYAEIDRAVSNLGSAQAYLERAVRRIERVQAYRERGNG